MKSRILFVDDEPLVLAGLRRSLRRYRDQWDTSYAEGGKEALIDMERSHFDIVVSDMRMKGMDGYELLCHVREKYPDTMRIVLSGQTDHETALKSVSVSHQCLSKPCEGDQLRRVLDRACTIRNLCTNDRHRETLSRMGSLPSIPSLYLELTEAMANDSASAQEIGGIIEQDIGMSVKIMQIVNSAFFGLSREVSSIREAVAYLGIGPIRALALSEGAFSAHQSSDCFTANDLKQEQRHGMLVASIARRISPTTEIGEPAFLAGMLHDLGVLLLATQFPDDFKGMQQSIAEATNTVEEETKAFGTTHGRLGAYLLGSWGLPIAVTEAVAFHHDPETVEHEVFDVVTAVHVANGLLHEKLPPRVLVPQHNSINVEYLKRLGLENQLTGWRAIANEIIENSNE